MVGNALVGERPRKRRTLPEVRETYAGGGLNQKPSADPTEATLVKLFRKKEGAGKEERSICTGEVSRRRVGFPDKRIGHERPGGGEGRIRTFSNKRPSSRGKSRKRKEKEGEKRRPARVHEER